MAKEVAVGATVSFVRLIVTGDAALLAASLWFTVTLNAPSAFAERSALADQTLPLHATVAVKAPVTATFRPFSEHVPLTAKAATLAAVTYAPLDGELTVTV